MTIHMPPAVWGVVRWETAEFGTLVDLRMTHADAVQAAKMAMAQAGPDDRHATYREVRLSVREFPSVVPVPPAVPSPVDPLPSSTFGKNKARL